MDYHGCVRNENSKANIDADAIAWFYLHAHFVFFPWYNLLFEETTASHKVKCNYVSEVELRWNRVHCQSGFQTFIMAQHHYVRTSAEHYRCSDNRIKVKTFVTSAWYHWWHVGPIFDLQICLRMANHINSKICSIFQHNYRYSRNTGHWEY